LLGSRLSNFLSNVLPTHPDYFSKLRHLALLRDSSHKQLVELLQYIEQIAKLIDREEHQLYISKVLHETSADCTIESVSKEERAATMDILSETNSLMSESNLRKTKGQSARPPRPKNVQRQSSLASLEPPTESPEKPPRHPKQSSYRQETKVQAQKETRSSYQAPPVQPRNDVIQFETQWDNCMDHTPEKPKETDYRKQYMGWDSDAISDMHSQYSESVLFDLGEPGRIKSNINQCDESAEWDAAWAQQSRRKPSSKRTSNQDVLLDPNDDLPHSAVSPYSTVPKYTSKSSLQFESFDDSKPKSTTKKETDRTPGFNPFESGLDNNVVLDDAAILEARRKRTEHIEKMRLEQQAQQPGTPILKLQPSLRDEVTKGRRKDSPGVSCSPAKETPSYKESALYQIRDPTFEHYSSVADDYFRQSRKDNSAPSMSATKIEERLAQARTKSTSSWMTKDNSSPTSVGHFDQWHDYVPSVKVGRSRQQFSPKSKRGISSESEMGHGEVMDVELRKKSPLEPFRSCVRCLLE
jgi:hypothetical protein